MYGPCTGFSKNLSLCHQAPRAGCLEVPHLTFGAPKRLRRASPPQHQPRNPDSNRSLWDSQSRPIFSEIKLIQGLMET